MSIFNKACFTSIVRSFGRAINRRRQAVRHMQTKLHTSSWFSLNVWQPYDARTIVLRWRAWLSSDLLGKLQDCRKCGCATIVRISWAVVWSIAFLRQPCNKTQVNCPVIARQSCGICGRNARVWALALVVRTPCVSYSSLSAAFRVLWSRTLSCNPTAWCSAIPI